MARRAGVRVAASAARRHALPSVLSFLERGGTLNDGRAVFDGNSFPAPDEVLGGLKQAASILAAGGAITESADGHLLVSVAGGITFDLTDCDPADALHLISEQFVERQYSRLPVMGKIVLDIGANIGDTALYFAAQGARHVYAFEPFARLSECAQRNVALNKLQDAITVIPAAISRSRSTLTATFDPIYSSRLTTVIQRASSLRYSRQARPELVNSLAIWSVLDDVRAAHPTMDLVIKMDCEGAEFDILAHPVTDEMLRGVVAIVVEYHGRTAGAIPEFLASCEFEVEVRSLEAAVGLIYAFRPYAARPSG